MNASYPNDELTPDQYFRGLPINVKVSQLNSSKALNLMKEII